jgi:phage-related holin
MVETRFFFGAVAKGAVVIDFIGMAIYAIVMRFFLGRNGFFHIMATTACFILVAIGTL